MIQDYISDSSSEHAHPIDNITPPFIPLDLSTRGHRKYLSTPHAKRSLTRVATLNRLTAGITSHCAQIPLHLHSTPLHYPPSEVGYALNAHKRLAQHRSHYSSNPAMNLVEDICTHLFRTHTLTQHFKMHQFIIYLVFRPSQAAMAEILCSGLLQCWVELGGFNAFPAGRSVASSQRVTGEAWEAFGRVTREMGPLEENMRVLRGRAEVWRRALEGEQRENDGGDEQEVDGFEGCEDRDG